MKRFLLIIGSVIALSAVAYWSLYVMGHIEGVELSGHGVAAMVVGLGFTILIGFGLMALIFFSNKHGHDEAVHNLYMSTHSSNDDNENS
ncbi:hypothetical protein ACFO5Q_07030 [Kordiimonas lipolytica]|uniref:Uncharacterized protein n=1 Tax=Kordiimonas lipolytica TaxID=1662421 RepID=A0ABV8U9U0_9PROT|nr:hypothetical protein [Kordiimonas lipolytica]